MKVYLKVRKKGMYSIVFLGLEDLTGLAYQVQRKYPGKGFVKGRMSISVATTVGACGLNISNVVHVIN